MPGPYVQPKTRYERFRTWTSADGLPSNHTTCALDLGGEVWAGTEQGIARLERADDGSLGKRWTAYGVADGLANPVVTSLAWDPVRGEVWIATLGGLSRWSGGRLTSYLQTDSGLPNNVVYDVDVDGDQVWAATAVGTGRLDLNTGSWTVYDNDNMITNEPWHYAMAHGGGKVWIGSWGSGVLELDKASGMWKEYRDPDKEPEVDLLRDDGLIHDVTSFIAYSDGYLWQSTYFGLSRYDGHRWRTWSMVDSPMPSEFIAMVRALGRAAWLATDTGLVVLDGETWRVYRSVPGGGGTELTVKDGEKDGATRAMKSGIPHDFVSGVWPMQDRLWVATAEGLCLAE